MKRSTLIIVVIAVMAAIAGAVFLAPVFVEGEQYRDSYGEFSSSVEVEDVRIVLPPRADQAAAVFFEVTNRGGENAILSEIIVEHGARAIPVDLTRITPAEMANIQIPPDSSRRFDQSGASAFFSGYDSSVVPGAQLRVRFRFGDASWVDRIATVEKATDEDWRTTSQAEPRNVGDASTATP